MVSSFLETDSFYRLLNSYKKYFKVGLFRKGRESFEISQSCGVFMESSDSVKHNFNTECPTFISSK